LTVIGPEARMEQKFTNIRQGLLDSATRISRNLISRNIMEDAWVNMVTST
jgi:hypothetical protein